LHLINRKRNENNRESASTAQRQRAEISLPLSAEVIQQASHSHRMRKGINRNGAAIMRKAIVLIIIIALALLALTSCGSQRMVTQKEVQNVIY